MRRRGTDGKRRRGQAEGEERDRQK